MSRHIKATSEHHAMMWHIKQKRKQIDKRMITVEEACLFGEWLNSRYVRNDGFWIEKGEKSLKPRCHTTKQLWELYQRFLGKKANPEGTPPPITS